MAKWACVWACVWEGGVERSLTVRKGMYMLKWVDKVASPFMRLRSRCVRGALANRFSTVLV